LRLRLPRVTIGAIVEAECYRSNAALGDERSQVLPAWAVILTATPHRQAVKYRGRRKSWCLHSRKLNILPESPRMGPGQEISSAACGSYGVACKRDAMASTTLFHNSHDVRAIDYRVVQAQVTRSSLPRVSRGPVVRAPARRLTANNTRAQRTTRTSATLASYGLSWR
jgi:hypothetical protein